MSGVLRKKKDGPRWQHQDPTSLSWVDFSPVSADALETAFNDEVKRISIVEQGVPLNVDIAQMKQYVGMKFYSNLRRKVPAAVCLYKWQSEDPESKDWIAYSEDHNREIEEAKEGKKTHFKITLGSAEFTIDFLSMQQTNSRGLSRPIRRQELDENGKVKSTLTKASADVSGSRKATTVSDHKLPETLSASVAQSNAVWESKDPASGHWVPYPTATNHLLETVFCGGSTITTLPLLGKTYTFDFVKKEQISEAGSIREIRRTVPSAATSASKDGKKTTGDGSVSKKTTTVTKGADGTTTTTTTEEFSSPIIASTVASRTAAAAMACGVVWESQDPNTNDWIPYPEDFQPKLEGAQQRGTEVAELLFLDRPYTFDLKKLTQTNAAGLSRPIRRVVKGGSATPLKYGPIWESQDPTTGDWVQYPADFQPKLEGAHTRGVEVAELLFLDRPYTFDLKKLTQTNAAGNSRPIRRIVKEPTGPSWESQDPDSEKWIPYPDDFQPKLEGAHTRGVEVAELLFLGRPYTFDLKKLTQTNAAGHSRPIRRVVHESKPKTGPCWESQDPDSENWLPYPEDFQPKLEAAHSRGTEVAELLFLGRPYTFDFKKNLQINQHGMSRPIRRTKKENSNADSSRKPVWESEDPNSFTWIPYPEDTAIQLEQHHAAKSGHGSVQLPFMGRQYTFCFDTWKQINDAGLSRSFRRRAGEAPAAAAAAAPAASSSGTTAASATGGLISKTTVDGKTVTVDTNPAALKEVLSGRFAIDALVIVKKADTESEEAVVVGTTMDSDSGKTVVWIRGKDDAKVRLLKDDETLEQPNTEAPPNESFGAPPPYVAPEEATKELTEEEKEELEKKKREEEEEEELRAIRELHAMMRKST